MNRGMTGSLPGLSGEYQMPLMSRDNSVPRYALNPSESHQSMEQVANLLPMHRDGSVCRSRKSLLELDGRTSSKAMGINVLELAE